jgi:hypothetical protein
MSKPRKKQLEYRNLSLCVSKYKAGREITEHNKIDQEGKRKRKETNPNPLVPAIQGSFLFC